MLLVAALVVALVVGVVAAGRMGRADRGVLVAGPVRMAALVAGPVGIDAFRGPGAWVDIYDYAPAYQDSGRRPVVAPEQVVAIAGAGFRTVFLQTAGSDGRGGDTVDSALIGEFLRAAHRRGLRVVAWYRPTFTDVERDLRHLQAAAEFAAGGERFDGVAVDIEVNPAVADPNVRSSRLLDLSQRLRHQTADSGLALAAVVPPPVLLDDVNPDLWPGFPWAGLRPFYDVWIPMDYWTMRTGADRDAGRFTRENITRLRRHLGDPDAAVHALGGVGDAVSEADARGFVEAAGAEGAVGTSIYDYRSTAAGALGIVASSPPLEPTADRGELHE
jgi:hypothetical protein